MNTYTVCEETRGPLVCPKPRRIGQRPVAVAVAVAVADPIRLHRWHTSHQADPLDLRSGVELLDIFSPKDSSPPFFCGSPPSRSANPLIHDARFGQVNPDPDASPPASAKKGCTWTKFGFAPAPVRIEGFGIQAFA